MQHTRRRTNRLQRAAHKHLKADELESSWPYISEALNINMDDPQSLFLCGVFMRKKGHLGLAAQLFRRVVALEPKPINGWLYFGCCLHDLHEHEAAMQIWRLLEKKFPKDSGVLRNKAGTLLQMGQFHDALNVVDRAIALYEGEAPGSYLAIKGMAALGLERWREGFENYRGLYGDKIPVRKYCEPEEPEWDGTPGKTVIVQGDQGIGDEIRFASVLPDMARDCRVILDCHPKLEGVFRRSFPDIEIHGTRKSAAVQWALDKYMAGDKADASHHISSLGRFYRVKNADFPRQPYLIADEERRTKWRAQLAALPRPWVGLAWSGGSNHTMREHRSFDLATFLPIVEEGGTFVDLSYHDSRPEVEQFNAVAENKIVQFTVDQQDYDDTLALIAELDLVICVPTTVMHAAGAIGKQCFVFNPSYPFWEFGKRDDMIWYGPDVVRIFRGTIEDLRDAYLRWCGQQATAGLHGFAELHHPAGEPSRADHPAHPPPAADSAKGPDRVHF